MAANDAGGHPPDAPALAAITSEMGPIGPFKSMLINAESVVEGLRIGSLATLKLEGNVLSAMPAHAENPQEHIANWFVYVRTRYPDDCRDEASKRIKVRFFPNNNKQQLLGMKRFDLADVRGALEDICAAARSTWPDSDPRIASIGYVLINAMAAIRVGEGEYLRIEGLRAAMEGHVAIPDDAPAAYAGRRVQFSNARIENGSKVCADVIYDNEIQARAPKLEISTACNATLRGVKHLHQLAMVRLALAEILSAQRAEVIDKEAAVGTAAPPMAVERLAALVGRSRRFAALAEKSEPGAAEIVRALWGEIEAVFAATPALADEFREGARAVAAPWLA
jgi:hypothetical protein